jgi:hypothetical protein
VWIVWRNCHAGVSLLTTGRTVGNWPGNCSNRTIHPTVIQQRFRKWCFVVRQPCIL